jgi:hypothetical protein
VFSLTEKVDGAISLKYQLPGEDLDPDGLISVADDSDIAVSLLPSRMILNSLICANLINFAYCTIFRQLNPKRASYTHQSITLLFTGAI